jgi:hypothetical protein
MVLGVYPYSYYKSGKVNGVNLGILVAVVLPKLYEDK